MRAKQSSRDIVPRISDGAWIGDPASEVVCRQARDRGSYLSAFRLLYNAYLRSGLARPNRWRLRILPHQLLASSSLLLVELAGRQLGTLSIVEDDEYGLPVERLCPLEVARLRRGGRRVAELTCLAAESMTHPLRQLALGALLDSALAAAAKRRVDFLMICVHPRHAKFYQARLGFEAIGSTRTCPWVCDRPAIAMFRPLVTSDCELEPNTAGMILQLFDHDRRLGLNNDPWRYAFFPLLKEVSPFPWRDRRVAAA